MLLPFNTRILPIVFFVFFIHASNANCKKQCSSPKQIDLFVLGGQSNAQGWQANAEFYPVDSINIDPSIKLNYTFVGTSSSEGKWIPMQAQKGRFSKGHFGPEVSMARKLKTLGYNPAIFKYTCGSTSIHTFWKTPGKGGQYDKMINQLALAISKLEHEGYTVKLRAFIWIQGESDATKEAADKYYDALKSIVVHFRTNVAKNKKLPIILGLDEQHEYIKQYPIVLESQKKLSKEFKKTIFTTMIGLPKADATHLTPLGVIYQGERIYSDYLKISRKK